MITEPKMATGIKEGFLKDAKLKGRYEVWGGVIQVKGAEGKYDPGMYRGPEIRKRKMHLRTQAIPVRLEV